jgi:hypothetical protein
MTSQATEATSINPVNFAEQLNTLRNEYDSDEKIRTERNEDSKISATKFFLNDLLASPEAQRSFQQNALEAATYGKKLVQLASWTGRGPVHANSSLNELLDFGDLGARMQDWLNITYGEDEFRVFHYAVRNTRTTALTVSWDKSGFENADGIIRANRERALHRNEFRPRRQEHGAESGDEAAQDQSSHQSHAASSHTSATQARRYAGDARPETFRRRNEGNPTGQADGRETREQREPRVFSGRPQRPFRNDENFKRTDRPPRQDTFRQEDSAERGPRPTYQRPQGDQSDQRPRRRPNYDA